MSDMKKVIIALSGVLVLSLAVVLFVSATGRSEEGKKAKTEMSKDCSKCSSATACSDTTKVNDKAAAKSCCSTSAKCNAEAACDTKTAQKSAASCCSAKGEAKAK